MTIGAHDKEIGAKGGGVLFLREVGECVQEVPVHAHALRRASCSDQSFEVPLDFIANESAFTTARRDRALTLLRLLAEPLVLALRVHHHEFPLRVESVFSKRDPLLIAEREVRAPAVSLFLTAHDHDVRFDFRVRVAGGFAVATAALGLD